MSHRSPSPLTPTTNALLEFYLREDLSETQFFQWYSKAPSPGTSHPLSPVRGEARLAENPFKPEEEEEEGQISAELTALKPELGISFINFIRDQADRILEASQQCYLSPIKTPHPAKYDYNSPVKSVRKVEETKKKPERTEKSSHSGAKEKKKRVQLFSSSAEGSNLAKGSESLDMRAINQEDDKMSKLEERFSNVNLRDLKILTSNEQPGKRNSNCARRSLDSAKDNRQSASKNSSQSGGQGQKFSKTNSGPSLNLGDFLVNTSSGKQSKKSKKKSRSMSPSSIAKKTTATTTVGLLSPTTFPNVAEETENDRGLEKLEFPELSGDSNNVPEDAKAAGQVTEKIASSSQCPANFENHDLWAQITKSIEKSRGQPEVALEIPKTPKARLLAGTASATKARDLVQADAALVTKKRSLDKLVHLYCYCLDHNLVLNLAAELFLLFELLSVQQEESRIDEQRRKKEESTLFLDSVHNCVYFASEVLKRQSHLLQLADQATLQLLQCHSRLDQFAPDVRHKLSHFLTATRAEKVCRHEPATSSSSGVLESIRFHSETDNVGNFPSDRAFQDFKKQRDLFYEILRSWKSEQEGLRTATEFGGGGGRRQQTSSEKFQETFGAGVFKLLNIQRHPTNMLHLARLFCSQMLVMCANEALDFPFQLENHSGKQQQSAALKMVNPLTLKSLERRFGAAASYTELPVCDRAFVGEQEFFRDFIQGCNDLSFLLYVKHVLVETIREKNEESFEVLNMDRFPEVQVDDVKASARYKISGDFCNILVDLRVAGKFLGFVDSIPFRCQQLQLSEVMLSEQLKMREQTPPPLDLHTLLRESLQQKRLIVTVPWLMEFCSVLDPIALQCSYYQSLFQLLSHIYKGVLRKLDPLYKMDPLNAFYLNLVLGELFENPLIPRELFFNHPKKSRLVVEKIQSESKFQQSWSLDESSVLSPDLVHASQAPYMSDLKRVLLQFSNGEKSSSSVSAVNACQKHKMQQEQSMRLQGRKRISTEKYVVGEEEYASSTSSGATLQAELETNFFHNHQGSLLKTVNFLADRIAWKMTWKVSNEKLEEVNRQAEKHLRDCIEVAFTHKGAEEREVNKVKEEIVRQIGDLAASYCKSTRDSSVSSLRQEVLSLAVEALRMLLPHDTSEVTRLTCLKVVEKQAVTHVLQWVRDNFTERFFHKQLMKIFDREWRVAKNRLEAPAQLDVGGLQPESERLPVSKTKNIIHLPSQLLIEIKVLVQNMLLSDRAAAKLSFKDVLGILARVSDCFTDSSIYEVSHVGLKGLESLTVTFAFALITMSPSAMTSEVQDAFIHLWKSMSTSGTVTAAVHEQLMYVISPRNLVQYSQSTQPVETWNKLEHFLGRLLTAEMLFPMVLEQHCLAISRAVWAPDLLQRLASCMKGVIDSWRRNQPSSAEGQEEFVQLLEWLAWFWQDVEDEFNDNFPEL